MVDAATGELVVSDGTRRVTTVESLSELTSALAFKRCDHKGLTRTVLERAGLHVPPGRMATFSDDDLVFLADWDEIVVKPARGEQGHGITVGLTEPDDLPAALDAARRVCPEVLLEARVVGDDLRVIVIGGEVVAASLRRPPVIVGDGRRTVAELIRELSRVRADGTEGASTIPLDATTRRAVGREGYRLGSVLEPGVEVTVRHTANLHTGGTMHDVTDLLHPELVAVSLSAAAALDIPVLGLDLIVEAADGPDYTIIEANEQPGLANHEPRPTAARFVDLLFPGTA